MGKIFSLILCLHSSIGLSVFPPTLIFSITFVFPCCQIPYLANHHIPCANWPLDAAFKLSLQSCHFVFYHCVTLHHHVGKESTEGVHLPPAGSITPAPASRLLWGSCPLSIALYVMKVLHINAV